MSNYPDGMSYNDIPGEIDDHIQKYVDEYIDDDVVFESWLEDIGYGVPTAGLVKFMMEFDDVMDMYEDWLRKMAVVYIDGGA